MAALVIRIAHVSDLHVLSRTAAQWRRMIFNKRLTGYANLVLRRGRVHRREYLLAVLAAAARAGHLVVTGDITNLALEPEYSEARALLEDAARTTEVSVVPGNHDLYLPSTSRQKRFEHHFGPFMQSDLPDLARDVPAGRFPYVKLRRGVAIIGLSTAVPRPPFVAAGSLGVAQLEALEAVLAHPDVRQRLPVVLVHHPPLDGRSRLARWRDGLRDAAALRNMLAGADRGLVLFGHIHARVRCELRSLRGTLEVISASGAALDHSDRSVRAGFNLYEIEDDGTLRSAVAHVVDPERGGLRITTIPAVAA